MGCRVEPASTGQGTTAIFRQWPSPPSITLSLTKRLRAAGFTEDQAEAVTDVVREASQADLSVLATKADITSAKAELKADISDTKAEILKWMFGMVGVQTLVILGALVTLLRVGLRP